MTTIDVMKYLKPGAIVPVDMQTTALLVNALREALAEYCVCGEPNTPGTHRTDGPCLAEPPAQRTWVNATTWRGLTDEERAVIVEANTTDDHGYDIWCNVIGVALAIEAKLKEKNT